jgi:hypothetical protein
VERSGTLRRSLGGRRVAWASGRPVSGRGQASCCAERGERSRPTSRWSPVPSVLGRRTKGLSAPGLYPCPVRPCPCTVLDPVLVGQDQGTGQVPTLLSRVLLRLVLSLQYFRPSLVTLRQLQGGSAPSR